MDVRLTAEQQQLRDAAAKLADDLGPGSVHDLGDTERIARLDKQIQLTGWRSLRSDEASAVEVAIVAEEFGRGLVDAPFLGPVLADDLSRRIGDDGSGSTIAVGGRAVDARGYRRALTLNGTTVSAADAGADGDAVDLTRAFAAVGETTTAVGDLDPEAAQQWLALALATTSADLVGTARGAHTLACEYAKIREQYGKSIGSYQAIAHLLAESLALIEGSVSILRHAAWAVDELDPADAIRAGRFAKVYCARAARTVCETAIQVHGGIGNTWECLAHVFLRRALTSTQLWPVKLEEISVGLP
ncbi:acyl-CoA dehydrogenase family protein [Mycobacterium sp.]|uniref:acyl-CoA dehydrogenase family protein n=1 Tax=Mycobacterium sp. TaxID=1785 RepID=UPI003D0A4DE3